MIGRFLRALPSQFFYSTLWAQVYFEGAWPMVPVVGGETADGEASVYCAAENVMGRSLWGSPCDKRTRYKRVNTMCELMEKFGERKMEEGRMGGRLERRAEGRMEGQRRMLDMARSLFTMNVPIEGIEKSSGLTRTEILALQDAPAE